MSESHSISFLKWGSKKAMFFGRSMFVRDLWTAEMLGKVVYVCTELCSEEKVSGIYRIFEQVSDAKKLRTAAIKYWWLCKKYSLKYAVLQRAVRNHAVLSTRYIKKASFSRGTAIVWKKNGEHNRADVSRWIPEFPGEPSCPPESMELEAERTEHWERFTLFT